MAKRQEDSDCDAPEEFASEQEYNKMKRLQKFKKKIRLGWNTETTWVATSIVIRSEPDVELAKGLAHSSLFNLVVREGKERRRQWAQKITPRSPRRDKSIQNVTETPQESDDNWGMLPDDIVKLLAAQEKKVFLSDSEEEKTEKGRTPRKKKPKN